MTTRAPENTQTSPAPHLANAVPVREIAVQIFENIAFNQEMLDRALSDNEKFRALNHLDRALVRMIVTTTIRRLGQIDDIIRAAMNGGPAPSPRLLQSVLRLAVAQVIFMKVPDHAAVNLTVDLAVKMGLARQKGLVNAVLRRVAREGGTITTKQDIPRLNIPAWMLDDWADSYGRRNALEAAQASLTEAPLDLSLRDAGDVDHWAKVLNASVLPGGTLRLNEFAGAIEQMPGFTDGAWWVQDVSASLPVKFMGDVAGKTVIDLCAAPGGKTAQLASAGAHVIAVDRSAQRLELLKRNLDRLNLAGKVDMVEADGTTYKPTAPADIVLIDAPCTATGTLRRNPDILLHRHADDVMRMTAVQNRLLENARHMLKPGGLLVYAVCSLQPDEGEGQIARFLSRHPEFTPVAIAPEQVGGEDSLINDNGQLRALPTHLGAAGGMDGFFTALLRFQG